MEQHVLFRAYGFFTKIVQPKIFKMEQYLIDHKIIEFEHFVDNAIIENRPVYDGIPGRLDYMMNKVKSFGEKYVSFGKSVNERVQKDLEEIEDVTEETRNRFAKIMNEATGKFKKAYWD